MASNDELARALRRLIAGQDYDAGSTAPDTLGNQALPVTDTGRGTVTRSLSAGRQSDYPDADETGPAYQGSPSDWAWRRQAPPEFGGYREHVKFADVDAAGTATIRPDTSANWWFNCAGSVTLAVGDMQPPPTVGNSDNPADLVQAPQASLVKVFLLRQKGANGTFPGDWKFSADVLSTSGSDSAFAPAAGDGQIDIFTAMYVPANGWFAFVSGRRMS
jgi:hypothetical protein